MNINYLSTTLLHKGGEWLGSVRRSIQRKFINGSDVTWGSNDKLRPEPTVKDLEEIGAEAASGALIDYTTKLFNDRLISEHFSVTFGSIERNSGIVSSNCLKIGEIYRAPATGYNFHPFFDTSIGIIVHYENIKEMLLELEKTFPHDKHEKYSKGWPV